MTKQQIAALFIPTALGTERFYLAPTQDALLETSPLPLEQTAIKLLQQEAKSVLGITEPAELPTVGSPVENQLCSFTAAAMFSAQQLGFELATSKNNSKEEALKTWNFNVESLAEWLKNADTPVEQANATEVAEAVSEVVAEAIAEATETSEKAEQAAEDVQQFVSEEMGLSLPPEQATLIVKALQQMSNRSNATAALMGVATEKVTAVKTALSELEKAVAATAAINQPINDEVSSILQNFGLALPTGSTAE